MNLNIVSLKSIYKMLTDNEYPTLSYPVFSKVNLKGLTLSSFWSKILLDEFRGGRYGKVIFRTEGPRNRFFSQMCNRDRGIGFYSGYAEELDEILNPDVLTRQSLEFASFLKNRDYHFEVLENKLKDYINHSSEQDCVYTSVIRRLLYGAFESEYKILLDSVNARANYCGFILALLTVIALYGSEIVSNGRDRQILRCAEEAVDKYQLAIIMENSSEAEDKKVLIFTNRKSSLWTTNVATDRFFGRESELYEVMEWACIPGRYYISGPTGIGKSELLRQCISHLLENKQVDAIGAVTYRGSIRESLIEAFAGVELMDSHIGDPNSGHDEVDRIFDYLNVLSQRGTTLLIDGVDSGFASDPLFDRLSQIPISIILSSRFARIRGYQKLRLELLQDKSCLLILKTITGLRFSFDQNRKLMRFFQDSKWRHTQSLVLLARIARKQGWDQNTIIERFYNLNGELLPNAMHKMFVISDVSSLSRDIMLFLSWCPMERVSLKFVLDNTKRRELSDVEITNSLDEMSELGWIEFDGNDIVPQIFVSESIRKMRDIDKGLGAFVDGLKSDWLVDVHSAADISNKYEQLYKMFFSQEVYDRANLFLHYLDKRTGEGIEESELLLLLLAGGIVSGMGHMIPEKCNRILMGICDDERTDDITRCICYDILLVTTKDTRIFEKCINFFEQEMRVEKSGIPMDLLCRAGLKVSYQYLVQGRFDRVKERCQWIYEHCQSEWDKLSSQYLLTFYYHCIGRYDLALKCCPDREFDSSESFLSGLANMVEGLICLRKHDWRRAEAICARMNNNIKGISLVQEGYRLWMNAAVDIVRGETVRGIEDLFRAKRIIQSYRGRENIELLFMNEYIAVSYIRAGQFYNAETILYEIKRLCEANKNLSYIEQEINLLLIEVFFKTDRLPDAVELMETIRPKLSPDMNPLYYEWLYNQAKICEIQGCNAEALKYASEAYVPLAEYYGANDKNVVELMNLIECNQ